MIARPSPNHNARPAGAVIDCLVLHDTEGEGAGALAWLTDPASGVSCHYLIDRDGTVSQLVPDARRAWHAGESSLYGRGDVNSWSLGIELVDTDDHTPYPAPQWAALVALVATLCQRYAIPLNRVIGHQHIAPGRKTDPGPDLDWVRLGLDVATVLLREA